MRNQKNVLIIIGMLFLIILGVLFTYFKITYSYFGNNVTGQLGFFGNVTYYSNYPSDVNMELKNDIELVSVNSEYLVKNIMFEIPNKYVFSHWNTEYNDSGIEYNYNDSFKLEKDINLYAIWKRVISYGDINLDSVITEEDAVLLDKYLNENTVLTDEIISNADVNTDGKIDLVDVDIIKQTCLGTKGYEDLLINKPVLIYDIYEGTINNGNNSNNNSGSTTNNNTGNSGSSTGSSKPSNNNTDGTSNGGNNTTNNNSNIGENNFSGNDVEIKESEKEEISADNNVDFKEEKELNNKSYVSIFIVVISLITLRFIVLIIKKIIKIKRDYNNCDK